MTNLKDQVALVTGGMGDIGRAICKELAGRGAHIAFSDIVDNEKAAPLLDEIQTKGVKARYDKVDVSDAKAVKQWITDVENDFGLPTLVIPNAAIVTWKSAMEVTPEEFQRELQINLCGAFHPAQTAAARLVEAKQPGRIVFVGSWAAHAPHPMITAYSTAKAGLRMLCQCMALELAPHGILINEVAPGFVDAGLTAQIFKRDPETRPKAQARVPIDKLIDPEDVALQVAYLCDPENKHMTGAYLLMDGGLSLVKK